MTGPTEDQEEATLDPTGKRFSAPDSDSEELVPVDTETDTVQEGRRCPAPASDSDELIPAATRRVEGVRPGDAQASDSSSSSRTSTSPLRPWTQADTDLSKAMTRVLRHRSNLQLDEAGYAKLTEVLAHPVMRRIHPTMDWMMYIVKANAKRRFALDETGTLIRAVQGHSIPVASSQLFRRLESRDFGATVPKWALHSTYFACIPSIMRHGLLPGGTRGTRYRRHVHLAMSYHPTAGLREGSDVILVVDLVRAHNAGCVFYVSDNNVPVFLEPSARAREKLLTSVRPGQRTRWSAQHVTGLWVQVWVRITLLHGPRSQHSLPSRTAAGIRRALHQARMALSVELSLGRCAPGLHSDSPPVTVLIRRTILLLHPPLWGGGLGLCGNSVDTLPCLPREGGI